MSTNPFRQTRNQADAQSATDEPSQTLGLSDGSGARPVERGDLSLDVDAVNSSYQRHVSFASPPVDSTIPAASYPSSPESARSPPNYFTRGTGLATPDYRTAIQSDPFGDLTRDKQEDGTLHQAAFNAQSNIVVGQPPGQPERPQERAVWDTLNKFAPAPSRSTVPDPAVPPPTVQDGRKSLDVDAFKRLLLTGNTDNTGAQDQQSVRRPPLPLPHISAHDAAAPLSAPTTSFVSDSQNSLDSSNSDVRKASFLDSLMQPSSNLGSQEAGGKLPPPAPAPRRARSVKARDASPLRATLPTEPSRQNDGRTSSQERGPKKAPTPPVSRRHSQRIPSNKSDDSIPSPSPTASPAELARPTSKLPPPPPIRRHSSTNTTRKPSHELAPTIEEPEPEHQTVPRLGSRRSSADPASLSVSRNPSVSSKPAGTGLMNPPPLPPPRRGRGSSRSSMDGFRPSFATLMGNEEGQEGVSATGQSSKPSIEDRSSLTASNADSILAELANLQKEVDAARRG